MINRPIPHWLAWIFASVGFVGTVIPVFREGFNVTTVSVLVVGVGFALYFLTTWLNRRHQDRELSLFVQDQAHHVSAKGEDPRKVEPSLRHRLEEILGRKLPEPPPDWHLNVPPRGDPNKT